MRKPVQVAKEIRHELRKRSLKIRDYSVQVKSGYKIKVKTDIENAEEIVKEVYYRENHSWLCVCVNDCWLPMKTIAYNFEELKQLAVNKTI